MRFGVEAEYYCAVGRIIRIECRVINVNVVVFHANVARDNAGSFIEAHRVAVGNRKLQLFLRRAIGHFVSSGSAAHGAQDVTAITAGDNRAVVFPRVLLRGKRRPSELARRAFRQAVQLKPVLLRGK